MTQEKERAMDDLIISYFDETISPDELTQLKDWISESSENRAYFKALAKIHKASSIAANIEGFDAKAAFIRISNKYPDLKPTNTNKHFRQIYFTVAKVAAIIIFGFILGYAFDHVIHSSEAVNRGVLSKSEFTVPLGSKSKVLLPDGTEVWLNAGSALNYYSNFGSKRRDVFLSGEGYFKVAKMKKPFIVHAGGLTVKALGTEFNVKAYADESITQAILVHGSIAVDKIAPNNEKTRDEKEGVILVPGQQVVYHRSATASAESILAEKLEVRDINPQSAISWKEKCWIIEREELQSLAVKLERKYEIKVVIMGNDLKKFKFTGILKNESIEQVLIALRLSAPIKYKFIKGTVYLSDSK